MLFKLRNNAFVSLDDNSNSSVFVCFRSAILQDISFVKALSYEAQELSAIVEKITGEKQDSGFDVVSIEDTLRILEEYGFIISGNTVEELIKKEIPLYRNISVK